MKLRKIISVLLVAVLTLSLAVSCGDEEKQLAAPEELQVSEAGVVTWKAVENATGYVVTVGDKENATTETKFTLADTTVDCMITVYATADGYKNSDAAKTQFTAKKNTDPVTPVNPVDPAPEHTVAISAPDNVKSGKRVQLSALVDGEKTNRVEWSVTKGGDYAGINGDGVLTAGEVTGDKIIEVTAAATIDGKTYAATTSIVIAAKTELTQAMLDAIAKEKVAFEGFVRLDVYENRLGAKGKLNSTYTSTVRTAMDGSHWFAQYMNMSAGVNQNIFSENKNGIATQIGVNLMNEEQNYTMRDDNGNALTWEASGFYNSFIGLTVSDFEFNTDSWRYEYKAKDSNDKTIARMASAANPYTMTAKTLELIIDDGEIMGIYSLAEDDLNMAQGYITEPRLYAVIDAGENVNVPTIGKYKNYNDYAIDSAEYNVLKKLHDAVEKARNAERYNVRITHVQNSNLTSSLNIIEGYEEVVTPDKCYFREYDIRRQGTATEEHIYRDKQYGYRKVSNELYNSFYVNDKSSKEEGATGTDETVSFSATRAFAADFKEAKPSFAFSEAIFTSYANDEEDGSTTYYVDENMYSVATTFYKGLGNDIALYGIFATMGYVNNVEFKPFVTVDKNGTLVGAGFFYNMSYMYGVMLVEYNDVNDTEKAVIDSKIAAAIDATPVRNLPASWDEINIVVTEKDAETGKDVDVFHKASEYIPSYFTSANTPLTEGTEIPFFGVKECLGDTYGFGQTTRYRVETNQAPKYAILLYYDVPLDINYSIQSSLDKIDAYLRTLGYTPDKKGAYRNPENNLVIVPVDASLDLNIYMYVENKA